MAEALSSYDELPYYSTARTETHPDRLATLATLVGMSPAPVDRCRVLEVGCASGGNLIPLAASLPGTSFLGIDRCASQVAIGQRTAADLALTNIDLRPLDLRELPDSAGPFD